MLIQLGAILALLSIYFVRLWKLAHRHVHRSGGARASSSACCSRSCRRRSIGALAHGFIKAVLFNAWLVCFTLIVGGAVLLWVDRLDLKPRYHDATQFTLPMYFSIGLVPVPRDDPRRVALRRDHRRRDAARRRQALGRGVLVLARDADHGRRLRLRSLQEPRPAERRATSLLVAVGFATSFIAAWIVVKTFLDYVQRHGFALFAWWRVIVGSLGLIALALGK